MFLIKESKLNVQDIIYDLYETCINFNEEYNDLKHTIILQEHNLILEGKKVEYLNEAIVNKIIDFVKSLIEKVKKAYSAIKMKFLEFVSKIGNGEIFAKVDKIQAEKSMIAKMMDGIKNNKGKAFLTTIGVVAIAGTYTKYSIDKLKADYKYYSDSSEVLKRQMEENLHAMQNARTDRELNIAHHGLDDANYVNWKMLKCMNTILYSKLSKFAFKDIDDKRTDWANDMITNNKVREGLNKLQGVN